MRQLLLNLQPVILDQCRASVRAGGVIRRIPRIVQLEGIRVYAFCERRESTIQDEWSRDAASHQGIRKVRLIGKTVLAVDWEVHRKCAIDDSVVSAQNRFSAQEFGRPGKTQSWSEIFVVCVGQSAAQTRASGPCP